MHSLKLLVSDFPHWLYRSRHCPRDRQLQRDSLPTAGRPARQCPLCRFVCADYTHPGRVLPELHGASSNFYDYWSFHLYPDTPLLARGMLFSCSVRRAESQGPLQAGPSPLLEFRNVSVTLK